MFFTKIKSTRFRCSACHCSSGLPLPEFHTSSIEQPPVDNYYIRIKTLQN